MQFEMSFRQIHSTVFVENNGLIVVREKKFFFLIQGESWQDSATADGVDEEELRSSSVPWRFASDLGNVDTSGHTANRSVRELRV